MTQCGIVSHGVTQYEEGKDGVLCATKQHAEHRDTVWHSVTQCDTVQHSENGVCASKQRAEHRDTAHIMSSPGLNQKLHQSTRVHESLIVF